MIIGSDALTILELIYRDLTVCVHDNGVGADRIKDLATMCFAVPHRRGNGGYICCKASEKGYRGSHFGCAENGEAFDILQPLGKVF